MSGKINGVFFVTNDFFCSTRPGRGIIEVVPHSVSRDALGKQIDGSLADFFRRKWSNPDEFRAARRRFIESSAAYSLVSFLLQLKDRHNGNILVDEDGHVVHIDFGFIFDISPGGELLKFGACALECFLAGFLVFFWLVF